MAFSCEKAAPGGDTGVQIGGADSEVEESSAGGFLVSKLAFRGLTVVI